MGRLEWLALRRRIEELELVEAQDALVDLSGLLARAYDLDHVAERGDDQHLDGLRKHRSPNSNAKFQFTRVHPTSPVTLIRFIVSPQLPPTPQWNESRGISTSG